MRYERREGVRRIVVMPYDGGPERELAMPEAVYDTGPATNAEFATTSLRFSYTSLVTPTTVFEEDLASGERTLLEGHRGARRATTRPTTHRAAVGHRGRRHPGADLLRAPRRRRPRRRRPVPPLRLRLLRGLHRPRVLQPAPVAARRGFVFAIAHVRGGGEMGRPWYDDGKMLHKRNTFTDFIAAAEHLVAAGYTAPDRLAARGGSAGGLLMGAIANLRPDLFAAVVAEVPFVDCLTTILDETLPAHGDGVGGVGQPGRRPRGLRLHEGVQPLRQRGGPGRTRPSWPPAGLNDPRVSYWEPAKWVQALRAATTSGRPIYLKTELGAGHQGPSGRYDAWKDEAFVFAFLLDALGRTEGSP